MVHSRITTLDFADSDFGEACVSLRFGGLIMEKAPASTLVSPKLQSGRVPFGGPLLLCPAVSRFNQLGIGRLSDFMLIAPALFHVCVCVVQLSKKNSRF